ncbi:MAG: ROK family transcriptional regulator [Phycisphaerae bacterium]|nr:ROK family transcriptional regulator [Phycisphaerae bacterium]
MSTNAIDSKTAGERNEKLVIELLREHKTLSQARICVKTGLGSSTISYIVGRLRDKGLIFEQTGQSSKRGAKPVLIAINAAALFVVGTEINPSYLLTGIFNFKNELIDQVRISLDTDHSVQKVVHLLEINIKGLLGKNEISDDKLIGIGITLSGSISSQGVVQLSSPLGWKNVPLKELLSEKFGCPISIYTTKVRLLAEINAEPALQSKNIVYFNVANGVGATVVVDGRLLHGSTNRCGELGHIVIDPNGPVCGCGQQGCLEAHISGLAIAKKIKHDIENGTNSILAELTNQQDVPEDIVENLKQAIEKGDDYAVRLRDFIADKLSRSVAIAINLYDPDIIILAGYVNEIASDYFVEHIRNRFSTDVFDESFRKIEIISARAGQHALLRGVAAAVLQEQFKIE